MLQMGMVVYGTSMECTQRFPEDFDTTQWYFQLDDDIPDGF